jgi:hypothetical protein
LERGFKIDTACGGSICDAGGDYDFASDERAGCRGRIGFFPALDSPE